MMKFDGECGVGGPGGVGPGPPPDGSVYVQFA